MILNFKVIFEDASDTLFRAMNDVNNQTFTWTFTKKPVLFYFDHDNEIVLKQATTILGIPEPLSQEGFHLYQNIPNPVTNSTKIVYELNKDCAVQMNIRDISGKTVSSPVNEFASRASIPLMLIVLALHLAFISIPYRQEISRRRKEWS